MVDETTLDEDGRPVQLHPRVTIRTPGLAGRVRVHDSRTDGTRGAEETREALLEAMRRNDVGEDLTIEIQEPRERTVAAGSRAAGGDDDIRLEVRDPGEAFGQVVLYESEDGVLSWHFPEQGSPDERAQRGSETLTYRIPRAVPPPAADEDTGQRGILGAAGKKILKVLTFRLVKEGSKWLGARFADWLEARSRPPRLRSFTPGTHATPSDQQLTDEDLRRLAGGRALLFVHGTFSTAHGGFGRIPDDVLATLHRAYDGRVLAFDHPTVSVDPVVNAAWFAERVRAAGVHLDLDLVAHSRGGLVSRVLTERADLAGSAGAVDVGRLVMVATPNAGTALADVQRIDQLLNRFTSLLQLVPDNGITDALDIILAVVKQVATGVAEGLEGLMSMNPEREFLDKLNGANRTATRYFAAAANYEPPDGSALLRIARNAGTDLVFGSAQNDLVVPTEGVFTVPGAGTFPIAEPLVFDRGHAVDHSGYWAKPDFTRKLLEWLPGTA
jgi:hypothetical protein